MIKTRILLDTGPLVALLVKNDKNHVRAKNLFSSAPFPLITCEAVLSEASYLLRKADSRAPQEIFKLAEAGLFDLSFRLSEHVDAVGKLMRKYSDVPASLADACLIQCAVLNDTASILTFDSDFHVYRWKTRKSFEIL